MSGKKKTRRASSAAKQFLDEQKVATDIDTGEVMTWDGQSRWLRGVDELRRQVYEWTDDNVRDEVNSCPVTWMDAVVKMVRIAALQYKIPFDERPELIAYQNERDLVDVIDLNTGLPPEWGRHYPDGRHPNNRIERLLGDFPKERPTPKWDAFMDDLSDGREDLKRYIIRLAGYTFCGDPEREIVILLKGEGMNGKGVFLRVLRELMGDYASLVAPDFFKASAERRHTTELADLHRRRFIVQPEAADGYWKVQRLKWLAGGDGEIPARRMRQDQGSAKLCGVPWFGVNNTPSLQGGYAMKRRMVVIPCDFQASKPDVRLKRKLQGEYRGILFKLLQEATIYLKEGLLPKPDCVERESRVFLTDAASPLDAWLGECTESNLESVTPFEDLYKSACDYHENAGHQKPTATKVGRFLSDHSFRVVKRGRTRERCRSGILLVENEPSF